MPRPLQLPDELVEEVLLRLPPHEPAALVRAALVCRRWCRIVSDPGFRRRFREFHRNPPMLGMLCNRYDFSSVNHIDTARFIPTTAFCSPRTNFWDMRVLDARHGRVLCVKGASFLAVWDPVTDDLRELPLPQESDLPWTAAVLCSAAGACDHLDCHQGPFLVVFVGTKHGNTVVYTYSSDAAAWSEPVSGQNYLFTFPTGSVLVGNALYFGNEMRRRALKYDLELRQVSVIRLPHLRRRNLRQPLLTTTESGGLVFIDKDDFELYMWSRKDTHEEDANLERRVIGLKEVFPVDVDVTKLYLNGSGVGIVFMNTASKVYTIDLQTYKVKKVFEGTAYDFVPYMNFYTPALKGTCTGEGPSAGHSSA